MLIFISITLILFVIFFIPLSVEVKYIAIDEEKEIYEKYLILKILYIIPIFKFNFNKIKSKKIKKNKNKLDLNIIKNSIDAIIKEFDKKFNSIKIRKFILQLGLNFNDYVLDSYLIGFIYSTLSLIIGIGKNTFNYKNLNYNIYISKKLYEIYFHGILKFNLANTINILISIMKISTKEIKKGKVYNKNGRTTSDRKSNGNCNVIA